MDGVGVGLVLSERLVFQILPHGEGVIRGGADHHISFCSLEEAEKANHKKTQSQTVCLQQPLQAGAEVS